MGNLVSIFDDKRVQTTEKFNLDTCSKDELIKYITDKKIKTLEINDTFKDNIDFELEKRGLIPMCIELYEKLEETLEVYHQKKKGISRSFKKEEKYIKPQFDPADIRKLAITRTNTYDIYIDTYTVSKPTVPLTIENVTVDEFKESFGDTPIKKDMIGISKKMLNALPTYYVRRFVKEFNKIYSGEHPVDTINFGKLSYVYKGPAKGSIKDIKAYRPLMSIPVIVNHFHRILALRIVKYMTENNYLDTSIQKGGFAGQKAPIMQQILKLKSIIRSANKDNTPAGIMFIDISNAFGSLKLEALFEILRQYHVPEGFIDYICRYYETLKYYSVLDGELIDGLEWGDGLIQGCPLSPVLFVIAINYVLKDINETMKDKCGVNIGGVKMLFSAFIDDIAITAKDSTSMIAVYKELKTRFDQLGFAFNAKKSGMMLINTDKVEIDNIPHIEVYRYLGEDLSKDGTPKQSFAVFIQVLRKNFGKVDHSKISNEDKCKMFTAKFVPYIQKKMSVLYDLDLNNKKMTLLLIKEYMNKWGYTGGIEIFPELQDMLENFDTDDVLKNLTVEEMIETYEVTDNEIINYIAKNPVTYTYNDTKKDLKVFDSDSSEEDPTM